MNHCKHANAVIEREKNQANADQPYVIHKYNKYMRGADQIDGFLNNLFPFIGGKK